MSVYLFPFRTDKLDRMSDRNPGYSNSSKPNTFEACTLQIKARGEFVGSVYLTDNYSIFEWTGVPFDLPCIY
jgi:hypothetical protein